MTEKTDKLTLQQLKDVRELCLPNTAWWSIIDELISTRSQLEVERQQRETAEKELRIRSHQLVKADASVTDLENRLRYTEETLISSNDMHSAAEKELAALRGSQEPVGYLFESQLKDLMEGGIVRLWPVAAFGETVKLFTHPAKPVVVLPDINANKYLTYAFGASVFDKSRFIKDCIEALSSSGIVVKDGE